MFDGDAEDGEKPARGSGSGDSGGNGKAVTTDAEGMSPAKNDLGMIVEEQSIGFGVEGGPSPSKFKELPEITERGSEHDSERVHTKKRAKNPQLINQVDNQDSPDASLRDEDFFGTG